MNADPTPALRVFLSYRREDTADHAQRLYDVLAKRLGHDCVFMDLDTLEGGQDFAEAIDDALAVCDVVIGMIGPRWLSAVTPGGERRLDRADDWVRMELEKALARPDVRVIPTLVDGASMPARGDLPGALEPLADRHAIDLGGEGEDPTELVDLLAKLEREKLGTNLPVSVTSFHGREQELAAVAELLARDDVRLLTLSGPGGTGKTRLALEAARRAAGSFPDGVWWVALAPLREPQLVLESLSQVLGARDELARHIGDRRMLVVLDNFEHLMEAAAGVGALSNGCPHLKILVTSRERLQVAGEHTFPVPPLDSGDGVELFMARARAAGVDVARDASVAELCSRLDNLPLALELAAARASLFTAEQLLERLSQRLDLLKAGRDVDPRQQTLRATIAWSYDLLDVTEQRLFAMLSVFSGGCTYESAADVADADADTLQSLIDKSLVRRRETAAEPRYWMLETIRDYAQERLAEPGERRSRHADHFLQLAERAEPELRGPEQSSWLGRLELEHPNMRGALDWLLAEADAERGVRLAAALGFFWYRHSYLVEGRRWIERALDLGGDPASRATALNALGNLLAELRDNAKARASYDAALQIRRELGNLRGAATVLNNLGTIAWEEQDWDEAERCFEESLSYFREIESDWDVALGVGNLASLALARGDLAASRVYNEDALALRRKLRDDYGIASSLLNLGLLGLEQGRFDEAEESLGEGMDIVESLGDTSGSADLVEVFALIAGARDDARRAGLLAALADALRADIGSSLTSMSQSRRARFLEPARVRDPDAFDAGHAEGIALAASGAAAAAAAAECRGSAAPR